MTHNTEIVAWERINNGQHRIKIRCCGDAGTDHWHTMNVMTPDGKPVDATQRDANIQKARDFVQKQHEEIQRHAQAMLDLMGKVIPQ